jgi:hypothetical protein
MINTFRDSKVPRVLLVPREIKVNLVQQVLLAFRVWLVLLVLLG